MIMDKLKLRNAIKKRKPTFERQYANVMKQFKGSWNRPRGMHSKMRRGMRGKKLLPCVGFRSPVGVRGLTREGFILVVVSNISELQKVDPKKQIAVLASGLGMRKRVELLNKAVELKLNISNVKEPTKFVDEAKKKINDRKKLSNERKTGKNKKKVEKETKADAEKSKDASQQVHQAELKEKSAKKADAKAEVKTNEVQQ